MPALRWKKDPPDGTSYSYWFTSNEEWCIETKKRFLPAIGYTLFPPVKEYGHTHGIRFDTLAQAKRAAEAPREQLLEWLRDVHWRWSQWCTKFAGDADAMAHAHAWALKEDAERTEQRMRERAA